MTGPPGTGPAGEAHGAPARPGRGWAAVAVAATIAAVAAARWIPDAALLAGSIAALAAGRFLPRVHGALAAAAVAGATLALATGAEPDAEVPAVLLPLSLWLAGVALRERELVARRLADQGRDLEAERDAFAALSVRYERARIAAELHDVVAHAISVMVVQASAGQRLAASDPQLAGPAFRAIAGAARLAEADLERLAGLLGPQAASPADLGLDLVETLVTQAAGAGVGVALAVDGDRDALRGPAAHVAHRIVQEGLTNALRYAPGAPVRVGVAVGAAAAEVVVVNGRPPADAHRLGLGSGRGLGGLRERVEAAGGTLRAGPDGGGWRLAASLPTGVSAPERA